MVTDFTVTGKPAQFGRGVVQDVSAKLLDQFATNLSAQLVTIPVGADLPPAPRHQPEETIDLVDAAGTAVAKRVVPTLLGSRLLAVLLVSRLRRTAQLERERQGGRSFGGHPLHFRRVRQASRGR